MKLVTFEDPIWLTLQGEGTLVGTPSVFVRMHGCDFSCSFCDTKRSWEPGSEFVDVPIVEVAERVRRVAGGAHHLVITGGNPLVQLEELVALMREMTGFFITVETQASIFDARVAARANLMSLSPKLHAWDASVDALHQYARVANARSKHVQVKVVVSSADEVNNTLDKATVFCEEWPRTEVILQPEYSLGRANVKVVQETLHEWMNRKRQDNEWIPDHLRVIPQAHKTALFAR